jgi:tRNA(fMet)-specific endonuclease VapC
VYVLDTDHASIIQRRSEPEFSRLDRRMRARPLSDFYFTIVAFHELVMGANLYISKAKDETGLTRGYRLMDEILAQFKPAQVLSFDEACARIYRDIRHQKIRVGKMDLRIGAIVLSHDMTLLTRNSSDFDQIPNLRIEDWTK